MSGNGGEATNEIIENDVARLRRGRGQTPTRLVFARMLIHHCIGQSTRGKNGLIPFGKSPREDGGCGERLTRPSKEYRRARGENVGSQIPKLWPNEVLKDALGNSL